MHGFCSIRDKMLENQLGVEPIDLWFDLSLCNGLLLPTIVVNVNWAGFYA